MKISIDSWREWVLLSNEEKTSAYKKLDNEQKQKIWNKEYMKIIKLNCYPNAYKEKYDNRFKELLENKEGEII